jgi:antibiotic biosynthesis monooxygenase (ABM) superfamily enzyme
MPHPNPTTEHPVTVVVRRAVRAGREQAYEDWLSRLIAEASALDGFLGTDILRPNPGSSDRTYTSILRFRTAQALAAFEDSALRRRYLREVTDLVEADAVWRRMTGLELWFTPPPGTVVPQPSRFRMALLLTVVVWGLVMSLGTLVGLVVGDALPYAARLLVTVLLEVFLMTYVVMPWLTRALARWIYPSPPPTPAP